MAAITEANSGIKYGWGYGADAWDSDNDANLLLLGEAGIHLAVIDRDLTAPPGGESDGDRYIPAATATGAWAGHEGDIAVYRIDTWVFYTPVIGWSVYVIDEDKRSTYKSGGWSAGDAVG